MSEEVRVHRAPASLEAWRLLRSMLDDLAAIIQQDAESEIELLEGLRVLARVTALCAEINIDADPEKPWFFSMNTPMRYVGGPNPDGEYHLCTIDGARRYRIRGNRANVCYLGFQVLAGKGMVPRRMAAYVSDRGLQATASGTFELILSGQEPTPTELQAGTWVPIPDDASAIVVRQYIADRETEQLATYTIEPLDVLAPPSLATDEAVAAQLTAMAWTIAKLTTLHRTIIPELLEKPNQLVTAEAGAIGAADTTPDNLYMLGTFRLDVDQALVVDAVPPATRFWNLTLENIWHECFDVRRRRTSVTNAAAERRPNGSVRFVIAASDPGVANWLDTGGRHRGFMVFRWLDNPEPPAVRTRVVALAKVADLTE